MPRTFQGRLSLAFVLVFLVAVGIVSALTVVVLNSYLNEQERANLAAGARAVAAVTEVRADATAEQSRAFREVVSPSDQLNPDVRSVFENSSTVSDYANQVALADVRLRFGLVSQGAGGSEFIPADEPSTFTGRLTAPPASGQSRDAISYTEVFQFADPAGVRPTWYLEVSLSAPYTLRASTIANVVTFLVLTSLGALLFAIVVASILAHRFTTPLRRLTDAARGLAEGDLSRRVPVDRARTGTTEVTELSRQFNAMADQVQETMQVIRRDRDRSREFLADVSHELRTPLAALRTFNELLQETAGDDPEARAEFLEASAQQIERLDWLAQNLLDLSKLDSGLVRLDLRPEDLRTTVQSAVEQAEVAARRRGVALDATVPEAPLRVRHDPQRLGQVLSNLIGNALKFTPRGGAVHVRLDAHRGGARIEVADTGIGIDASELPHIFERFYRGARSNEARSSGSGLGLAIVRSIVEMHGGRVSVASGLGTGSTFTVTLPADPRALAAAPGPNLPPRAGVGRPVTPTMPEAGAPDDGGGDDDAAAAAGGDGSASPATRAPAAGSGAAGGDRNGTGRSAQAAPAGNRPRR